MVRIIADLFLLILTFIISGVISLLDLGVIITAIQEQRTHNSDADIYISNEEEPDSCYLQTEEYDEDITPKVVPAKTLPKGWCWFQYNDGSGYLKGPDGKMFFDYDQQTGEYRTTEDDAWSAWHDYNQAQRIPGNEMSDFKAFAECFIRQNIL